MNIFLIRHGETDANASKVHQSAHNPLSKLGEQQAVRLAERLKEASIDHIFASPFTRAKQTAEAIHHQTGKPLTFWPDLQEIKGPSEFIGKNVHDPDIEQLKEQMKNNTDPNWHYSDEENFWDMKRRGLSVMEKATQQKGEDLLLVTHGGFIRLFLSLCLFGDDLTSTQALAARNHIAISNTGISHCSFTTKKGWVIMRVNDTEHLTNF